MNWPLIIALTVIGIYCFLTDPVRTFDRQDRKAKAKARSEAQAVATAIAVSRQVEMLKLMTAIDAINLGLELEHEFRQVDHAQQADPNI